MKITVNEIREEFMRIAEKNGCSKNQADVIALESATWMQSRLLNISVDKIFEVRNMYCQDGNISGISRKVDLPIRKVNEIIHK